MEALSEKGIHLKMETEAFSAMASVSSMKGQEVGKYFGRKYSSMKGERGEEQICGTFYGE